MTKKAPYLLGLVAMIDSWPPCFGKWNPTGGTRIVLILEHLVVNRWRYSVSMPSMKNS
jgi:hypothetical protein